MHKKNNFILTKINYYSNNNRICLLITAFLFLFFLSLQDFYAIPKNPRILIFNSYHYGNLFSDQEMDGIKSVLKNVETFVEFMDSKRISNDKDYLNRCYIRHILINTDKKSLMLL